MNRKNVNSSPFNEAAYSTRAGEWCFTTAPDRKIARQYEADRQLCIIIWPAGFGKTTLLSEFVAELQQPVAWVSLDEADNDPIRFWTYLLTACQSIQPEIGEAALGVLQSPQQLPVETIATTLINDIVRLDTDLIIVLDDYHIIQNSTIHSVLAFLFCQKN